MVVNRHKDKRELYKYLTASLESRYRIKRQLRTTLYHGIVRVKAVRVACSLHKNNKNGDHVETCVEQNV